MSQFRQLRKRIAMFKEGDRARATLIAGAGKEFWALNRRERRLLVGKHLKKMLRRGE